MTVRSYTVALALGVLASAPAGVVAQSLASKTPAPAATAKPAPAPGKPWTLPKTPNGHPDLQGYWTSLSFTPLERPEKFGTREFLTEEELSTIFKAGVDRSYELTFANPAGTPVYDATVYGLDAWQNGVKPNKRTSLIVDPPNGRLPAMTPEGQARRGRGRQQNPMNGPEDLSSGVRCFTFGGTPIPAGSGYNQNTFILQGKDHVIMEYEWGSSARLIPLNGGPHLSSKIRPWRGDSRGRWEGNTLVIETTNFRQGASPDNSNPATARLIERLTRLDETTIEYKYTIDDPSTWTQPWTAIVPLSKVDGPLFEYACNEGNNGLVNLLEGARAQEQKQVSEGR